MIAINSRFRALLLSVAVMTFAIVVPLIVWSMLGRMLTGTGADASLLYLLHALCLISILTFSLHDYLMRDRPEQHRTAALILYAAALQILFVLNQASVRSSWDYAQIEKAAGQILKGLNPYEIGTTYVLYPPLYAQVMAGAFWLLSVIVRQAEEVKIWNLLFYLFQNLQFGASLAALWCAFKFSQQCNYAPVQAALLASAVTALSAPFCATITGHQVNIFIAALILFALTYLKTMPALSGIGVAIGTYLKVYPATLAFVWLWHRQWRPAFFAIGSIAILFAVQTLIGGGIHVWSDYLRTASTYINSLAVAPPDWLFSSPGLVTINYQLGKLISTFIPGFAPNILTCTWLAKGESIILAIYFVLRCLAIPKTVSADFVLIERACNLLSLLLLTGPSALMAHYAIGIPIAIWSFYRGCHHSPILTVISLILMLSSTPRNLSPFALQSLGLLIATSVRTFKGVNKGST